MLISVRTNNRWMPLENFKLTVTILIERFKFDLLDINWSKTYILLNNNKSVLKFNFNFREVNTEIMIEKVDKF